MAIAYGYDVVPGAKDRFLENAQFAINTTADLVIPGRTLLAIFSFLCYIPPWFPGASTQKFCLKVKEASMQTREGPYQYVKQQMTDGMAKDCVLVRQLERDSGNRSREDEELLKDIMATFYFGGVETMDVTTANFMLAMALHPDAQRRAQEEIDRVVGSHRLPSFDDRPSLLYVEALYREVQRWRPVSPVSLPHVTRYD
ncbi:Cytochrome P450 [Amanita muscaria]